MIKQSGLKDLVHPENGSVVVLALSKQGQLETIPISLTRQPDIGANGMIWTEVSVCKKTSKDQYQKNSEWKKNIITFLKEPIVTGFTELRGKWFFWKVFEITNNVFILHENY